MLMIMISLFTTEGNDSNKPIQQGSLYYTYSNSIIIIMQVEFEK